MKVNIEEEYKIVDEELKKALFQEFGKNGSEMVSRLEDFVIENPYEHNIHKANETARELTRLTAPLRQFLYPVLGGNEGIVDLFLNGLTADVFDHFDLFYMPKTDRSYLICCDVINNLLGPDPATYGDSIKQLQEEGKIEIYKLNQKSMFICSTGTENQLLEVMVRDKISPHRRDQVIYDFDEQWSSQYRADPTDSGHYWEDVATKALDNIIPED